MSDALVEQLSRAFDALAEQVRAAIADHKSVKIDQLAAAIQAERRLIAEKATIEATAAAREAVTERLAADFSRREAQLRQEVRAEAYEAGLQQGRANAAAELESTRAAIAALRAETDTLRSQVDAQRQAAAADLQQTIVRLTAERDAALHETLERVAHALRSIDTASSLSQTLDTLAAAAGAHAVRLALFLVRGDRLRLWKQSGFEAIDTQPPFEVPLDEAGPLAQVVAAAQPRAGGSWPPFLSGGPAALIAVPLALNGRVTGVLCAEPHAAGDAAERLTFILELLARHAARVLESLTAIRLAHGGSRSPGAAAGM
jgi:hypothetical protein